LQKRSFCILLILNPETGKLKGTEAAAKGIGAEIIKNTYKGLKELVRGRFSNKKTPPERWC